MSKTYTTSKNEQRLWVHCLALYVLTCAACILLYFEYQGISRMRLLHVTTSASNPSHFTILVRAIPSAREETLDVTIEKLFSKYHGSSYLSHQRIYRAGTVQKIMGGSQLQMFLLLNGSRLGLFITEKRFHILVSLVMATC